MVGVDGDLVNRASFNHNLALKCIILIVEHHYGMMKAVRFAGFLCSFTERVSAFTARVLDCGRERCDGSERCAAGL